MNILPLSPLENRFDHRIRGDCCRGYRCVSGSSQAPDREVAAPQFGGTEYDRALAADGSRRKAEARLDERAERVDALHIRPSGLATGPGLPSRGSKSRAVR